MKLKSLFSFGSKSDIKEIYEKGALVVDVRNPNEFASGHFDGSINVPLGKFNQHIDELKSKNQTIITVCMSGIRSGQAKGMLKRAGVEAHNGGGWTSFKDKVS